MNQGDTESSSDEVIGEKYARGEVRIVTEQARYALPSIVPMIESGNYQLNPEFQRRHRWDDRKKSRLIESFIINVPIPPIFLYEDLFAHYEVMDGLQRLTAIQEFYLEKLVLTGLEEWPELNNRRYSELPRQLRAGVDRRYLSSIILLHETAKDPAQAVRLKQLVFERINSGGVTLEPQESRNAIYNGPLNQLCIRLSRNKYLCRTWGIPEPTPEEASHDVISVSLLGNKDYRTMFDVELVLRFFAYRQRFTHHRGPLRTYFDAYLKRGNIFPQPLLARLEDLFTKTIEGVYNVFGESAFWLWRRRREEGREERWNWLRRPTVVVYDPLMYAISNRLNEMPQMVERSGQFKEHLPLFYERHYDRFEGRYTNLENARDRIRLFDEFVTEMLRS